MSGSIERKEIMKQNNEKTIFKQYHLSSVAMPLLKLQ